LQFACSLVENLSSNLIVGKHGKSIPYFQIHGYQQVHIQLMRKTYFIMFALLSTIGAITSTLTTVTYGSNYRDEDKDDPKNQACYNAGFAD
jgi:hypothetical protein